MFLTLVVKKSRRVVEERVAEVVLRPRKKQPKPEPYYYFNYPPFVTAVHGRRYKVLPRLGA